MNLYICNIILSTCDLFLDLFMQHNMSTCGVTFLPCDLIFFFGMST